MATSYATIYQQQKQSIDLREDAYDEMQQLMAKTKMDSEMMGLDRKIRSRQQRFGVDAYDGMEKAIKQTLLGNHGEEFSRKEAKLIDVYVEAKKVISLIQAERALLEDSQDLAGTNHNNHQLRELDRQIMERKQWFGIHMYNELLLKKNAAAELQWLPENVHQQFVNTKHVIERILRRRSIIKEERDELNRFEI